MTDISPEAFEPHLRIIMELLNAAANSISEANSHVSSYIIDILTHLASQVEGNQLVSNLA